MSDHQPTCSATCSQHQFITPTSLCERLALSTANVVVMDILHTPLAHFAYWCPCFSDLWPDASFLPPVVFTTIRSYEITLFARTPRLHFLESLHERSPTDLQCYL